MQPKEPCALCSPRYPPLRKWGQNGERSFLQYFFLWSSLRDVFMQQYVYANGNMEDGRDSSSCFVNFCISYSTCLLMYFNLFFYFRLFFFSCTKIYQPRVAKRSCLFPGWLISRLKAVSLEVIQAKVSGAIVQDWCVERRGGRCEGRCENKNIQENQWEDRKTKEKIGEELNKEGGWRRCLSNGRPPLTLEWPRQTW